jgi:hypothetical protein
MANIEVFMSCPNPLKPEDCTVLSGILQYCHDTGELIQKCKKAGLPVDELEAANNAHIEMASALKREFFPLNS